MTERERPITVDECQYAVGLARIIKHVERLQGILAGPGDWKLEIQATDGDESGGTIRCSTIVPNHLARLILQALDAKARVDLQALGIVDGEPTREDER